MKMMLSAKNNEIPISRAEVDEACRLAEQYRILLAPHDRLGFVGSVLEIPTVFADGKTADECVANVRQALRLALATMLATGAQPPAPSVVGRRSEQVNLRLSSEEKRLVQEASRRRGFRGISDFIRAAILERVRLSD